MVAARRLPALPQVPVNCWSSPTPALQQRCRSVRCFKYARPDPPCRPVPAYRHGLSLPFQRRLASGTPSTSRLFSEISKNWRWPSAAARYQHHRSTTSVPHSHCHRATGARRVGRRRVSPGRQDNRCRVAILSTSPIVTKSNRLRNYSICPRRPEQQKSEHQNRAFVLAPALRVSPSLLDSRRGAGSGIGALEKMIEGDLSL